MIPVCDRIVETLQNSDARSAPWYRTGGGGIEGATMTIPRQNHAWDIEIARILRNGNRNSAGQSHITLASKQAFKRHLHSH